jgi:hypothetical protein
LRQQSAAIENLVGAAIGGTDNRHMPRLSASDLGVLGHYLYGPRWQSALARELEVSRQLVVYWASGKRAITLRWSHQIAALARARHDKRIAGERSTFIAMADAVTSSTARSVMLAMIANEVTARIAAISALTGEIEDGISALSKIAREEVLRHDGFASQGRSLGYSGKKAARPSTDGKTDVVPE